MASRLELHQLLVTALGSQYVYYQPPESIKLNYPCIIYSLGSEWKLNADGQTYATKRRYMATVIDKNPDSEIPNKLPELIPYCSFDRAYVASNLNHFVFDIFY